MKHGTKDLMSLHDDMSRYRKAFATVMLEASDAINNMALLDTVKEHEVATRTIIQCAARLQAALEHLAAMHGIVRLHKPLVAGLANGDGEVATEDLITSMKRDLVAVTVAAVDVDPGGQEFWDKMAKTIAIHIQTLDQLNRVDAACRKHCAEAGLDYDKLLAGDADEIARAEAKGIRPHTYGDFMEATGRPVVHVMTVDQLLDTARAGATTPEASIA